MAAWHALVMWVALGGGFCIEVRESSRKTCNDPATPQTCPRSLRWELTNHPSAFDAPSSQVHGRPLGFIYHKT